jgi:hypothetical protein
MGRLSGTGWFALPNRIFEVVTTPYELAVIAYLQRCAGPDGSAWPSFETIASACKMSARQVRYVVGELETRGVIRIQRSNGRRSHLYVIELFNVAPPATNVAPHATEQYPEEQDPVVAVSSISSPSLSSEGGIGKGGNGGAAAARVELAEAGFAVPPTVRAQWQAAYPAIDVDAELQRAFAWVQANPKHRKSNWHRFLVNWLSRTQDRTPAKSSRRREDSASGVTPQQRVEELQRQWNAYDDQKRVAGNRGIV